MALFLVRHQQEADVMALHLDGELNRMPAALPAPEGEGLLSDRYQLCLITTGRELLDLQKPLELQ